MAGRDPAAFAAFVAARSGALHRAAYLLVGDAGLAQDLVQEALTKTYVAAGCAAPEAAEAYARKAITTTAITWFRKRSWNAERSPSSCPRAAPRDPPTCWPPATTWSPRWPSCRRGSAR